ncbi:MAG: hypothetical protein KIT80_14225 [Chitinophagaceae bacterium]|nr:hypothetical protein [Chitinophagaceae bacterium]MCW5928069.1 hypothetical protein [Chitinophagaceae bacterium]
MPKYRTIELSDRRFERDHLRFITVKTPNLKGRGDICVFVPPDAGNYSDIPVVILLHGVYGSAWSWAYGTGVHLQAAQMIAKKEIPPMIIAMPSDGLWGDGSGFLPHHGYDFEKWIAEDVPAVLQEAISGISDRSPFFIGGLSMGGFGALRIGVKYGKHFMAVSAHSSITSLSQLKLFVEEGIDGYRQTDETDEDVLLTIKKYRRQLPYLRFDCGVDDLLIEHNRYLHTQLTELEIEHVYEENPGGHEWAYWEKHISDSLIFFGNLL